MTLPWGSSSVPSPLTLPSAVATPGVDLTCSSVEAGIVGGCEKSDLTAWRASTATSTPFWVRSKRFLKDSSIVSVNTSVPTTKATPITTAKPVRTDRSLRESRPRSATLVIGTPCCTRVGGGGDEAGSSCDRLHQVEHALGVLARAVVDDLPVAQDHDAVGDRRRLGVVGNHDHRLAELVDGL